MLDRGTTLSTLPRPAEVAFGDRPPWAPVSTATLVAALGTDRGNWAAWICRGIGPAPMPLHWFRPAAGRPRVYRIDAVLCWLAGRHGEHTNTVTIWRNWLVAHVGLAPDAPEEAVRSWAHCFAKSVGPAEGRFTGTGFDLYLGSLLGSETP